MNLPTFLCPIIFSNNTMIMMFFAQMREPDDVKVEGMMKYKTYTWDLVHALESAFPASCKTPATSIESIRPISQPWKYKKNPEKSSNYQQIILYCLGLCTENPGLREVDLEPCQKSDSDKINKLKPIRKNSTENKSYHTTWTHKWESSNYRGRLGSLC